MKTSSAVGCCPHNEVWEGNAHCSDCVNIPHSVRQEHAEQFPPFISGKQAVGKKFVRSWENTLVFEFQLKGSESCSSLGKFIARGNEGDA